VAEYAGLTGAMQRAFGHARRLAAERGDLIRLHGIAREEPEEPEEPDAHG